MLLRFRQDLFDGAVAHQQDRLGDLKVQQARIEAGAGQNLQHGGQKVGVQELPGGDVVMWGKRSRHCCSWS